MAARWRHGDEYNGDERAGPDIRSGTHLANGLIGPGRDEKMKTRSEGSLGQ